ncbi:glutamine-hydrolyzing GMP synthase [Mollicutes bacterium LVI A0039]|nr:glutamine-hydrolyzing GMP synthase [Mollicutes bacterium LVI A0039]
MNEKARVIVVDFGSQYNQLIVRKVRELNVSSELVTCDFLNQKIADGSVKDYSAIIFSGGPNIVTDAGALKVDTALFDMDIPILGVCYGMQLIGEHFGSDLVEGAVKEYGAQSINITCFENIFKNLAAVEDVWMSHGYEVTNISDKLEVVATTKDNVIASIKVKGKEIYGVQFHLEVTDTKNGMTMLDNFLSLAEVPRDYTMASFLEVETKKIQEQVKDSGVILGLSGGVDSTVVAALLAKAIPGQTKCILVDHGLMRKNEVDLVVESLKDLPLDIKVVDAKELFLSKLAGVEDPEQKRKIIGNLFVEVFDREKSEIADAKFLAQGTLYTDVIESGTDTAQTIKSHHNVGGLPEDMEFELLEPLNKLFKDEVRKLGVELGLSDELVHRQPFPGPGLAIRVMGDITEEKLEVVRESDYIFKQILIKHNLYQDIWQSFTVLTNTKTVGVKGDERSYEYVLALRAINSIDGMTARAALIPMEVLVEASTEITNRVRKINRVVYDITNKPPSTIEWE